MFAKATPSKSAGTKLPKAMQTSHKERQALPGVSPEFKRRGPDDEGKQDEHQGGIEGTEKYGVGPGKGSKCHAAAVISQTSFPSQNGPMAL